MNNICKIYQSAVGAYQTSTLLFFCLIRDPDKLGIVDD